MRGLKDILINILNVNNLNTPFKKMDIVPWPGGPVGWSMVTYTRKIAGPIPSQGIYLGCVFDPQSEHVLETPN